MRSTNRKRALLVSSAVILLCMTVVVGMTWALFTDYQPVYNHLEAGDLDITLERVGLTKYMLDEDGYLTKVVYTEAEAYKDFSNTKYGDANVFDVKRDEKIVPKTEYTADMKITNESDVAFEYWIEVVIHNGLIDANTNQPITTDTELANQLEVTITYTDDDGNVQTVTKRLKEGVFIGSEKDPFDVLGIDEYKDFSVTAKFLDDAEVDGITNDNAKNMNAYFDLIVHASQYTGKNPATITTP